MVPADLVSYLVGWNEQVLEWFTERQRGVEPDFPARGWAGTSWASLPSASTPTMGRLTWPQLLDRLARAEQGLIELVSAHDDTELYGRPWYRTHTAGRMIQFNSSSPYANARRRIRAWLRDQGL